MSSQIMDKFKHFDAYAKTLEDFRIKTATGAAVTLTGGIIMLLLFISELYTFMSPNISEELFVDTSRGHKIRINIDVVIPRISCNYLELDAMDSSGEQHLHMEQNIHKQRLDLEGNPIKEEPIKEVIAVGSKKEVNATDVALPKCGSCYGAAFNESQCCNTCQDVKMAYRERRWALPDLSTVEQCKNDQSIERTNSALKEGCQIYGYMEVNRVGGSFHIAPGKSFSINHMHVHDVQPYSSKDFNTTHIIKHLSFGNDIKNANTAPLDGAEGIATAGAVMFQYYVKIVPTMYVNLDGTVLHTNQFSVTRHQRTTSNAGVQTESGMPGIFLSYELSPLMVKYTEKERSIGHFATNICAIIGGVFTVAGVIDALLYYSLKAFESKTLLGKTG